MSDCRWVHTDVAAFFWFHGVINGAWDVHSAPQLREKWVDYLLFERNSRRIELQMGSNGYSGRKSAAYILPIKPVDPVYQSKQEVSRENNRPCSMCGRSNDVVHKQKQKKIKDPPRCIYLDGSQKCTATYCWCCNKLVESLCIWQSFKMNIVNL